jgi:5'-3' exonuclease
VLDTIRVKFPIAPTDEQLKGWTQRTTTTTTGVNTVYMYNPVVGETTLRFTFRPVDYTGNPMLSLECSLPKLIFDHNYQMLPSIDGTVKIANLMLADIPHLPHLDLSEGVLIRLDLCYNHQVGDMVSDYIKALGNLEYPHRRTKYHRYEGTEFRAKHKTTKFYDKEHESGLMEAHGILRQEITMLNPKDIQKLVGKSKPTLLDMTRERVTEELRNDLEKLGLLNNSIADQDTASDTLCETYGEYAGFYYWALLKNKITKSRKRIAKEAKMHPRSIDRKLKKIVDAGVPLTLTDREEPLPPLNIEL